MALGRLRLALAAVWLIAGTAAAEVYRWTDAQGNAHFTAELNQVPASQRDAAKASAGATQGGSLQRFESRVAKPAGVAPPVPAAPAESPKAAGETYGGRDEAAWRGLATKYRDAIERLEEQAENCTGGEFRWTPGAGSRAYREEAAEADACGRIHSELQMNRTWLETLEERAHEAGAPPGWVRD